jgi:glycosyltransferase involved in cell wall biosynthesis
MYKNKKKAPALILKTSITNASNVGRREILRRVDTIRNSIQAKKLPNVYVLQGDFSDKEMNELYNHPKIKAMVSLTKGEGFGRPLLEFSLTNKPVIASNWSGQIDFLNPEFTALVNGKLNPIHPSAQIKDLLVEGSQWFAPDLQHTFLIFNDIFTNYKNWKVKGKRQGYHARTNFSFENMKEILGKILDKNVPEIAKQVELKLPKLQKEGNSSPKLPQLKLPKLQKVK